MIAVIAEPIFVGQCENCRILRQKRRGKLSAKHDVSGCIFSEYVKWLEQSGIRVVGLPWDTPLCTAGRYPVPSQRHLASREARSKKDGHRWKRTYKVAQHIFTKTLDWNARRDPLRDVGHMPGVPEMMSRAAASNFSVVEGGFVGMDPFDDEHERDYVHSPEQAIGAISPN